MYLLKKHVNKSLNNNTPQYNKTLQQNDGSSD